MEAQRNSGEDLFLGVVGRVVAWYDFDVGRTSKSAHIYDAYRNRHERTASLSTDVNDFTDALASFTGLVLPSGVSINRLLSIRNFTVSVLVDRVGPGCDK